MLNAEQAAEAIKALPYPSREQFPNREARSAALREYRTAEDAVTAEFRAYLEDTYGWAHSTEGQQKLWTAAWSNGHASGYQNVEEHYSDYADLTYDELDELDY